jgi:hypothetical protein
LLEARIDHADSNYLAVQVRKETYAWNLQLMQFAVVGDEEVNPRRCRSCQMYAIRLTDSRCGANYAVSVSGFDCEWQNLNVFAVEKFLDTSNAHGIVSLSRTGKHFSHGKNAGA